MLNRENTVAAATVAGSVVAGWVVGTHGSWGWTATWVAGTALWCVRPPSARITAVAIALLTLATGLAAVVETGALGTTVYSVISALLVASAVAVCAGTTAALRQRGAHRRLGWELARAVEEREMARVDEAVTAERAVMAGEIHDRLGHRLTLIAVQLGRLTLDDSIPAPARAAVERIRAEAATAAEELGETVGLLTTGDLALVPAGRTLTQVVDGARGSLEIEADVPADLQERLGPHSRAALERVLTEALTNAAKHAPGRAVRISLGADDGIAELAVRNDGVEFSERPEPAARRTGAGHGLESSRLRLAMLGGDLRAGGAGEFVLRARVPLDATPTTGEPAHVAAVELDSGRAARRSVRVAWLVPVALAVPAAVFAVGYFAFATVAAVLSPADYGRLEIGMPESDAAAVLPAVVMLDEPNDVLAIPPAAECRYYESEVSLFERRDVYRVCFTDGVVSRLDVIPADAPS